MPIVLIILSSVILVFTAVGLAFILMIFFKKPKINQINPVICDKGKGKQKSFPEKYEELSREKREYFDGLEKCVEERENIVRTDNSRLAEYALGESRRIRISIRWGTVNLELVTLGEKTERIKIISDDIFLRAKTAVKEFIKQTP